VPTVDVLNEMSRLSKESAELREELAEHSEDHHITEVITSLEKRTLSKEVPELNMSLLSFFRAVARELTMEINTTTILNMFKSSITPAAKMCIHSCCAEIWNHSSYTKF
jgi:hypothetical protein